MNSTDTLGGMLDAWSALAGAAAGGAPAPLTNLLMQAHLASSTALMRAGQRGSDSWMDYLKATGTDATLEQRVDAARGHLRRLAEISADESRQVQQQLLALDEQLRALVPPVPQPDDADPVRRAHIKP